MFKFALVSFLFLQVAFSQDIQGGASLNVQGSAQPSLGFNQDFSGSASSKSAAAAQVPDINADIEKFAGMMSAAAQTLRSYSEKGLAEMYANLQSINEALRNYRPNFNTGLNGNVNAESSMRPSASGQGNAGSSFAAQVPSSMGSSINAQAGSGVRPSINTQAGSSVRPSMGGRIQMGAAGAL